MAQTHAGASPEGKDPVLVRPYVGNTEAAGTPQIWPQPGVTAEQPAVAADAGERTTAAGDTAGTAALPAVAGPPTAPPPAPGDRAGLPVGLRIGVFVLGVGLALGVAAYFVLGFGVEHRAPMPSTALPAVDGRLPIAPSAAGSAATTAPASPSLSPSPGTVPASASQQPLVPVPSSGAASAPPPPPVTSAAPTGETTEEPTAAPPPVARTGQFTAASGRCLALGGLLGLDGSPVQVAGCRGGSAQTFTLDTDGSLRVGGRCARPTGDGTVRIDGCGDADAGQWRAGADGTLVSSSGCLTDPGRSGATTRVAACSGAAEQTWTLP